MLQQRVDKAKKGVDVLKEAIKPLAKALKGAQQQQQQATAAYRAAKMGNSNSNKSTSTSTSNSNSNALFKDHKQAQAATHIARAAHQQLLPLLQAAKQRLYEANKALAAGIGPATGTLPPPPPPQQQQQQQQHYLFVGCDPGLVTAGTFVVPPTTTIAPSSSPVLGKAFLVKSTIAATATGQLQQQHQREQRCVLCLSVLIDLIDLID